MTLSTLAQIAERLAIAGAMLAVGASAVYVARDLHQTQMQVRASISSANSAIKGLNDTLAIVNRPCGGGHPCGTLANVNKAVTKAGDAIVSTQLAERAILPHVTFTLDTLQSSAVKLGDTAEAVTGTANSATGALDSARDQLDSLQGPISASGKLLVSANGAVDDFDTLLKSPDVTTTLHEGAAVTTNLAGISYDLHHETTKLFNPAPCTTKKCKVGRVMGQIGTYASMAATGFTAAEWFRPLHVKLAK